MGDVPRGAADAIGRTKRGGFAAGTQPYAQSGNAFAGLQQRTLSVAGWSGRSKFSGGYIHCQGTAELYPNGEQSMQAAAEKQTLRDAYQKAMERHFHSVENARKRAV